MHKAQRLVNHVALILDASYSMTGRGSTLSKVADEQIKHLALRSEELQQETRVSVYHFGDATIECLIFDMDVMRLPSIADLYKVLRENTALIDATLKAQEDLATTSQLYGDHAFLTFVLTDGEENRSKRRAKELSDHIFGMPDNWSMGFLVPDRRGQAYVERLGVLADSVAIWDTTSATGLNVAASAIRTATDNFMTARATGVRGTRSVFSTGAQAVNKRTVTKTLKALPPTGYGIYPVQVKSRIDDYVRAAVGYYNAGMGYYQLTKTETIQASKQIVVVDKKSLKAYGGDEARDLIGLPKGQPVRVRPDYNPDYDIFVQSTSINRNLMPNTRILIKK